ncbi:hypothetical protein HMPREF2811_04445 [Globicatella sp. HMSC072A10]|uniref:HdeD family acid-resistance protein n=1 Tax=Globicatella sp. HMSC072A10 TaxID=1739315 RepID=UPI0008D0542D|nr:hypothetical protein [Globicatella sp. HMSC072A10]OFK59592.1 hypothetical protein HMPREF2811_04445 [Globicatella sp. HMSC072A10]
MKQVEKYSYLISGLLWIIVGLFLIIEKQLFVVNISILFSSVLLIIGIGRLVKVVVPKRERNFEQRLVLLITGVSDWVLAFLMYFFRLSWPAFLSKAIGYYQLFIGVSLFISWLLLRRDRVSGRVGILLSSVINIIWGVASIAIKSSETVDGVVARLGFYLVFIGLTILMDARDYYLSQRTKTRVKRRIRVPLPVIFTILLPKKMLDKINHFIQEELSMSEWTSPELKETDRHPVLKVFIHVGEDGFDQMGHVDLSYKGRVYAYGNYDIDSERLLGAIGEGVLFSLDDQDYIDYCLQDNKTLFEYRVVLTAAQEVEFEKNLNDILKNTQAWVPTSSTQLASYLGKMTQKYKVETFKFKSSRYKTYFVLGTNCVLLADQLIGASGLDLLAMVGILAPGTYYDYFEKEFQKPNSIVVGKTVHNPVLKDSMLPLSNEIL